MSLIKPSIHASTGGKLQVFQILPLDEKPTPGWYHPSTGGKLQVFQTQQNPPSIYKSCSHPSTEWNAPSAAPDSRLSFQLDENLPNPGLDKCLV
jgi:hypothetical protein